MSVGSTVSATDARGVLVTMSFDTTVMLLAMGQGCSAFGTRSTNVGTNTTLNVWLSGESISAGLSTAKGTSLFLEFGHGNRGQGASIMVLSLMVVDLVDRLALVRQM